MKKIYYIVYNVGKVKYLLNYYDGIKVQKDGSAFFDIRTFKNKKDLNKAENELLKEGYKYKNE